MVATAGRATAHVSLADHDAQARGANGNLGGSLGGMSTSHKPIPPSPSGSGTNREQVAQATRRGRGTGLPR